MLKVQNIRSLSEFQRNTRAHLRRLKSTGQPEVLTVNGKAELVVQDAVSYQKLLETLESADVIERLRIAIKQADRGEGRPMRDALTDLAKRKGVRLGK
jgi:PHD/YefM family antitoxin component YafN of YafNO toxin-antitoxin module